MRVSDYALLRTNIASALGRISQLFLAFVSNLFVARANWANVLVGLSAFMGTAPGDINSHCSCKRFAQLEVLAKTATSAKFGELPFTRADVAPICGTVPNSFRKQTV